MHKLGRWLAAAAAFAVISPAETVRLRILDENGSRVAARIRLRDAQERLHPVPQRDGMVPAHPRFPELGVIVQGQVEIDIPEPGRSIEVDRGTEYLPQKWNASERGTHELCLQRWIDMAARGWWSADLHVHREPAEMPLLLEAAGLNFAPDITRWNQNSNLETWPERPLIQLTASRFYSVDNAEDERPWGAALFFGLRTPMHLYHGKAEWPAPTATWQEARAKGAFLDLEKVIWWGAPVMAALIRPDTIGVANNHFLEEGMLDSEAWGRPRDRKRYPGQRGFANYIFDLYYTYLSAGLRVPASAGSANGVLRNPLGYSRSYVYLGSHFTPEGWFAAQKAGRNFVTNGPMLFLTVNGERPGAILPAAARNVKVDLLAIGRSSLERAELIVNGKITHSFQPGNDPARIQAEQTISLSAGDWVAARCLEANAKTVRFAHTSPLYAGEVPRRDPAALARLCEWIDRYMEQIRALPDSSLSADQKQAWLAQCRKARAIYE
jgi:hypothetical protein